MRKAFQLIASLQPKHNNNTITTPAKHRGIFHHKNFRLQPGVSKPGPPVYQADALPTGLRRLKYPHTKWSNKVEIWQNLFEKRFTSPLSFFLSLNHKLWVGAVAENNNNTEAKPCFANTCEESCELLKKKNK